MSPLVDVTNTVVSDIPKELEAPFNKDSSLNKPKNVVLNLVKAQKHSPVGPKNAKETLTNKCNNGKPPHPKRKKIGIKKVAETCEEPRIRPSSAIASLEPQESRVPPHPFDDLLSHALSSLNLGKEGIKTECNEACSSLKEITSDKRSSTFTGSSNNVGPPSSSYASSYQCIACGLELSSVQNLTNHLVKHIYEGLHAASWLNQAMTALLPPVPTSNSSCDSNTTALNSTSSCSLPIPNDQNTRLNLGSNNDDPSPQSGPSLDV